MTVTKLMGFDPQGEVFFCNGRVYRGIFPGEGTRVGKILNMCRQYDFFKAGLIGTAITDDPAVTGMGYDMVLEHEKVPFITYPHEWPTEMFKHAALLQLELNERLFSKNLLLKDCGCAGNILFDATKPVFIDFLSVMMTDELVGEDWLKPDSFRTPFQTLWDEKASYFNEIFCRMFYPYLLYPLYMMRQNRFLETRKRIFETTLNTGAAPITENECFPRRDELFMNYHTCLAAREYALVQGNIASFLNILHREIDGLPVCITDSRYTPYYSQKNEAFDLLSQRDWQPKQKEVFGAMERLNPKTVLDIGANTGWYSILAAKQGHHVVAIDNDEACMNLLYQTAKRENLPILPLVIDLANMTPDVNAFPGCGNDPHVLKSRIAGETPLLLSTDKRLKCDAVLALAIVHHLILGLGHDFAATLDLLTGLTNKHLIMEFVSKEDPLIVGEMDFFPEYCRNPQRFGWYTQGCFHATLSKRFDRVDIKELSSHRTLFICQDKKAAS